MQTLHNIKVVTQGVEIYSWLPDTKLHRCFVYQAHGNEFYLGSQHLKLRLALHLFNSDDTLLDIKLTR